MPIPGRPVDALYFVAVRTIGIREGEGVPHDAVLSYSYWHPVEREWHHEYAESLDAALVSLTENNWTLVQRTDFDSVYESEPIYQAKYGSFFEGRTAQEIMKKYGLEG